LSVDQLSNARLGLIEGVSEAVLKDVIDGLRAANPPVLTGREANQIMQGNQVQEDRVGQLVDVVCKKGDVASGYENHWQDGATSHQINPQI
ncbi:hypothetical protein AMEX_G6394, partial [Astyanax mexicanus]